MVCTPLLPFGSAKAQDDFTIGVYHYHWATSGDNFSEKNWDYALMDMARIGCNWIVQSGWTGYEHQFWAAAKHWGIRGVTTYGQLNEYQGPGTWDPCDFVNGIITNRDTYDALNYNGESVGDTIVGHIMTDEPENNLDEDQKNFLRAYADVYHQYNPVREIYVNHDTELPWYDLHEKRATCSVPTISINSQRINDRISEAQSHGFENFTVVAQLLRIAVWMDNQCNRIEWFGLGPCSQDVFDWLDSRTTYQDVYEEILTAYNFGANGVTAYIYNAHMDNYSIVDIDGHDNDGRRAGFSDAAHDIRAAQGWPGVTLYNNGQPFNDRGNYPPGQFTLTADATSSSGTIEKVVFGKTTDGGGIWTTIEDTTAPYSATFSASSGETVIFRAQAVDTAGKKSIYDAYMIYIN